ncbi:MAG: beta-lactamase family protein [Deltaproteobacteria bacterium]|nr:beta-lactamase family protein [Deltaproteobacteria bacterium]
MKRIIIASIILIMIIAGGLIITWLRSSTPSFDNLDQAMEYLVSNLVEKDKSVKNCVLSVMKGDGSFSWSGATGIASQDNQVPMTKDTPIYIASITKLYTATAIMRLYESGALSLDDPMAKYLPEGLIRGIHVYQGKDYSSEITIKQLLSHTSGIADYYTEKPKGGNSLFELFLQEPDRSWTVDETIERARKDLKPNFPPGTAASYSDTNFQLLGKIIEAVTGKPLHIVFEEFFFRPLGLTHTWLIGRSKPQVAPSAKPADVFYKDMNITKTRTNGSYWADGGIVSTADEMIVFLKALNEGRLVSSDTLKLMHNWHKLHFPLQYGYGTMYVKFPRFMNMVMQVPSLWGHSGSTGSFLYYSEDLNLYLAGTIDQTASQSKPFRVMSKVIKAMQLKR